MSARQARAWDVAATRQREGASPVAARAAADIAWRSVASIPFIYAIIVPLVILDVAFSLYQAACFPLYRIARVRRRDYFVLDRARLPYLNAIGKFNCAYCSYANGLLAYVREIAARTEQYWCPIQHARLPAGTHDRYGRFLPYGDATAYAARTQALRRSLALEGPEGTDDSSMENRS